MKMVAFVDLVEDWNGLSGSSSVMPGYHNVAHGRYLPDDALQTLYGAESRVCQHCGVENFISDQCEKGITMLVCEACGAPL